MFRKLPSNFVISKPIDQAQQLGLPIVALESAVITHGLPVPHNLQLARDVEEVVRQNGAQPATTALLKGHIHIGLTEGQLVELAASKATRKISMRDFGIALAGGLSGGTTVAATLFIASKAGIRVFATGGIGGVHRGHPFDVSADLLQLGRSKVVVVCAGAKSILDLPATREYLETQGVSVLGYQTEAFPAFYAKSSGLLVDQRVDSPAEVAKIALQSWEAGLEAAILLVVPPPDETAMAAEAVEDAIQAALSEAEELGIHGAATTPFLLQRISELTDGESLLANLALLKNNARIAAQVATAVAALEKVDPY